MASRDYKNSGKSNRRSDSQSFSTVKWMLITASLISVAVFLVYLRGLSTHKIKPPQVLQTLTTVKPPENNDKPTEKIPPSLIDIVEEEKTVPQFDFYTILPEKEVVVPDYEINTRTQEERKGDAKKTNYIMQAGSFKDLKDAEKSRQNFASMGIESRIERAKIGEVVWYRIKIGPYNQIASVNTLRNRLRQSGIDVIVTEIGQ